MKALLLAAFLASPGLAVQSRSVPSIPSLPQPVAGQNTAQPAAPGPRVSVPSALGAALAPPGLPAQDLKPTQTAMAALSVGVAQLAKPDASASELHGGGRSLENAMLGRAEAPVVAAPLAQAGLPLAPADARLSPVSPRRALKHAFGFWKDRRVFDADLTVSDHRVLGWLAIPGMGAATGALTAAAGWLSDFGAGQMMLASGLAFVAAAILLSRGHFKEARDAERVRRNARAISPETLWDKNLVKKAARFEQETGWTIVWTKDTELLVRADPKTRTVKMSAGWIAASDKKADARRLAYLNEVLRRIRHGIETSRFATARVERGP